jgi:glycosyltransferase involved in cell wall biosynthesis
MELADYTVECLKALKKTYPASEIHVIAYSVNPEAPFEFDFSNIGKLYNRDKFDHEKIQLFSDKLIPDLIICSGWTDRSYLKVIRTWRKKAKTVLCMDNKWLGTLKQKLACFVAQFYLPRIFDFIWVPFHQHALFAKKMGFKPAQIKLGFYSANTGKFNKLYEHKKDANTPKVFVCVARYIPQKNLPLLWNAFIELCNETQHDWELWNLGIGQDFDKRIEHPKIKHCGFVQPNDMDEIIQKTGVFVLPSLFEPWGVVVHEFASAGYPMVVSSHVGAHAAFVENGENGYVFNPNVKEELKSSLFRIINLSNQELKKMGMHSSELSKKITQEKWVEQCVSFVS